MADDWEMVVEEISSDAPKEVLRLWSVEIPAERVEESFQQQIEAIKNDVKIPGFRPGKVPEAQIRARYGDRLLKSVLETLGAAVAKRLVEENQLRPALTPQMSLETEEAALLKGNVALKLRLRIEMAPDFDPPRLEDISLEKLQAPIEEGDVDKALQEVAKNNRRFAEEASALPSEEGDLLVFDFDGTLDGKSFKGGKGRDARLVLGEGALPDFEKAFKGRSAGFKDSVSMTLPDNYPEAALAGQTALFEIHLKTMHKALPPDVDEDFAKFMRCDSLKSLKEKMREEIIAADQHLAKIVMKRQILDYLESAYDFMPPPTLVEREFAQIWQQFLAARQNQNISEPIKKNDEEALQMQYRKAAEARVRAGLVIAQIGETHNVKVEKQEIQNAIIARAAQFPGREKEIAQFYAKTPQAQAALHAPLFEEKVMAVVMEKAKIAEKRVSREELLNYSQKGQAAR